MLVGAYQMKNNKISLIGCGWLGVELLKSLNNESCDLIATTAHDKLTEFKNIDATYLQLDLSKQEIAPAEIISSDIFIYMIPPQALDQVKSFFNQLNRDKKVIFISSTSVYSKKLGDVNEDTIITNPSLLKETEDYLKTQFKKLTILRPGGLYGKKRHPIYHLSGKQELKTGEEYLHLAHQEDCVNAILSVLRNEIWGETFNIVSDLRILKHTYYTFMAKKLGLLPPQYILNDQSSNETRISNEKSKNILGITYKDPNEFCTFSE